MNTTYEDLTPDERETLELLRNNAPDAPEALANLDEKGRARVLGALSTGTGARDEPILEADSAPQSTGPTTFADRVWEPTVTVAGKKVPAIPSSVGAVVVLVAFVLLVRACVGAGSAAWCDDIDEMVDRGWNSYFDGNSPSGMSERAYGYIDDRDYTDVELTEVRETLEEASSAGWRFDGKEGARAWEDSLRDAC